MQCFHQCTVFISFLGVHYPHMYYKDCLAIPAAALAHFDFSLPQLKRVITAVSVHPENSFTSTSHQQTTL